MDCFLEMRKDRPLDCFGIYPQVLPLAFNWLHQQKNLTISEYDDQLDMSYYSEEQLIYWGWTHHMKPVRLLFCRHSRTTDRCGRTSADWLIEFSQLVTSTTPFIYQHVIHPVGAPPAIDVTNCENVNVT